ncbi:hypothetical protein T11_5427 [Trichinella zimbabwensis]|uniref:Uncharacterized protein n=1 Tax=Trichinella zimbabwensis TaxID=268475 RepID=A0A0V1H0K5_9BILA|nr:hypothetical protein T11_5427 [Trichinella zimbabwensis]
MYCESKENKKQYLRARILLNGQQPRISHIPCGLVARICGFHPQGPGSIPGMGKISLCYFY